MIYLLITTSINNNYIRLDKLTEIYSNVLKPSKNEKIFFTNKNRRRAPAMQIRIGYVSNIPNVNEKSLQTIDRDKIKELNLKDRILEYKESITTSLSCVFHEIKPIIIENNGERKTFLDEFGVDVHYTDNNKCFFKHKGINELMDIKSAISAFEIKDDDIIIKITGRYKVINDSFFRTVLEEAESYDAFIKFFNVTEEKFMRNDCVLGLFAIRCKYLKSFEYDPDLEIPETQFAEYIRKSDCRIFEMGRLGLSCKFSDTQKILEV
jgi:hypothetical protein